MDQRGMNITSVLGYNKVPYMLINCFLYIFKDIHNIFIKLLILFYCSKINLCNFGYQQTAVKQRTAPAS